MYDMTDDLYACDFCGFEMEWDDRDDIHGEMWGCEKCGVVFCSKCFIEKHGQSGHVKMLRENDFIKCPDCYENNGES